MKSNFVALALIFATVTAVVALVLAQVASHANIQAALHEASWLPNL